MSRIYQTYFVLACMFIHDWCSNSRKSIFCYVKTFYHTLSGQISGWGRTTQRNVLSEPSLNLSSGDAHYDATPSSILQKLTITVGDADTCELREFINKTQQRAWEAVKAGSLRCGYSKTASAQRPCYGDQNNLNVVQQSENLKVNLSYMNVDMTRGWTSCL